jgi:hypothetical protein
MRTFSFPIAALRRTAAFGGLSVFARSDNVAVYESGSGTSRYSLRRTTSGLLGVQRTNEAVSLNQLGRE